MKLKCRIYEIFCVLIIVVLSLNSTMVVASNKISAKNKAEIINGQYLLSKIEIDLSKLNLNTEQKNKIIAQRIKNKDQMKVLRGNLKFQKENVKKLLFDPNANNAQINLAFSDLLKIKNQMEGLILADFLSIRDILTANQKNQLNKQLSQITK